jgi:gas vesicle protein
MATFHEEIKDALDEEERKEKASIPQIPNTTALPITGTGIARSLLGIMGMLPDPNCKTPKKTIIQHVIDLITGESNDSKASSLLTDLTAFAGTLPSLPKMPDTSPLSDMASSVFQTVTKKAQNAAEAVRGKVGPLMPKQSNWREQLEQLQKEVANRQEHLTLLPQIHDLEGKIQKLDGEIQQAESNPGQKGGPSSQPAVSPPPAQEVASRSYVDVAKSASKRGGRITRRIRASTRALRQRARE